MQRKTYTLIAILALSISMGSGVPYAHAADSTVTDMQGSIMQILLMAIAVLNTASFMLLKFISSLADPNVLPVTNGGLLLRLWQISRDLMNLIFVVMLLAGAILTIVFAKQDIVKQHITKFILAVVLVNFSWFFPRVIFDVANVTTATIYSLPKMVSSPCKWRDGSGNPKDCVVLENVIFDKSETCNNTNPVSAPFQDEYDFTVFRICLDPLDNNANTSFGIINGLVMNHSRMVYLGIIRGSPPGGGVGTTTADGLKLTVNMALVAFLHIMLVFPLAALAVALIVRIPILWLTVAFMPLMFLGFVIGDKFVRINSMTIFTKHFLTAAFLPALVAVPITIGYIMLNTFEGGANPPSLQPLTGNFALIPQVKDWTGMLWVIMSFGVMWIGAFWAMKSDDIYAKFTEPIHQVGNSFLKLPMQVPIIPHDTNSNGKQDPGEGLRLADLGRLRSPEGMAGVMGLRQNPFGGGSGGSREAAINNSQLGEALQKVNSGTMPELEKKLLEQIRDALRSSGKSPDSHKDAMELIREMNGKKSLGLDVNVGGKMDQAMKKHFTAP